VVDFLSDAVAVCAFALPAKATAANAAVASSAIVDGPIAWATSASEVWVARRPGYVVLICLTVEGMHHYMYDSHRVNTF
jgi:hypothetical protein